MSLCICGIMGENTLSWVEHVDGCPKMRTIAVARIKELEAESKLLADNGLYQLSVIDRLEAENARLREQIRIADHIITRVRPVTGLSYRGYADAQANAELGVLIEQYTALARAALQEGSDD